MSLKRYRADFRCVINGEEFIPDSEYFSSENDKKALKYAELVASDGIDFSDVGHVDMELTHVAECDDDWNEIGLIYY